MPIPDRGFYDPKPTDSVRQRQENADSVRTEHDLRQQEQEKKNAQYKVDEEKRREMIKGQELARLENLAALSQDNLTREKIFERIREMRAEKEPERVYPPLTPSQQARLDAEQKAGREAVAIAEAQLAEQQRIQREYEAQQAPVERVHVPNEMEPNAIPEGIRKLAGKP
jgi:hypothetical protein